MLTTEDEGYLEVTTEGLNVEGQTVSKDGVLARLPYSSHGTLQLDMDGSEYTDTGTPNIHCHSRRQTNETKWES